MSIKKKKKKKSELVEKCSYFIGNVVVEVRHILLPDYHLILSLLEPTGVGVFWEKKLIQIGETP